jgi:hypothetical protein
MGVCILAGALHTVLAMNAFTLAWTHSIEKVRWEEDYRREGQVLVLESARIRGSAAGMEPPPDSVFSNGVWHYTPASNKFAQLTLANSSFGGNYELCIDGKCRPLAFSTKTENEPTIIKPCEP